MGNNEAWEVVFKELNILEVIQQSSIFPISAKQINEIGKREARLMAKFDTRESLPTLFKNYSLNINAVANGSYIIFHDPNHQSFIPLPDYKSIKPQKITPVTEFDLQTLIFSTQMSESNAIDFAHHSNILSAYCGEPTLKLTTRGRFFSDSFTYSLGKNEGIAVKGVQIEVDAGYEGQNQFLIIEAKSGTRNSFNIRQLYYPFRHFQNKTDKQIRNILLSFSNGVYYFTEITFQDAYYSYTITSTRAFEVVIEEKQYKTSLQELVAQQPISVEKIPVPQADDLNKIVDLLSFLDNGPSDKYSIAEFFEFDERQSDYYSNAGAYIGLIEKEGNNFLLNKKGRDLIRRKNRQVRNIELAKHILSTSLFNDIVQTFIAQQGRISDLQIIKRIANEGLTGTTPHRRASTIKAWLNWMLINLPL